MSTSENVGPTTVEGAGSDHWHLSEAPIRRALVHLCVPMAAALAVSSVYNVINAVFIGSQHDTTLLAAVTLGSPVLGLIMAVGNVFGIGGGAQISRLLGASENDPAKAIEIKRVSSFSLWGAVIVGVVLGIVGLCVLHPFAAVLGAHSDTLSATVSFVGMMLIFMPVMVAAVTLEQFVRAEGAARRVMVGLIGSTIITLVLDVLFILILHWGVAGAALSTGLAHLAMVVYFVAWLQRHSEHVDVSPRWFTLAPTVSGPVLGVGVSSLLQFGVIIASSLVMNNLITDYGDGPLAALGVAVRIAQVPEFLVMGITIGVLPLFAYSFGKGDRDRLMAALRASAVTVGSISILFSAAVFLFREQVFAAFVSDPSVLTIGVTVLAAQLVAMIANGFTGLLTSLFQATGRASAASGLSLAQAILFFPLVFAGNYLLGLPGIIWALTVTESIVCVVAVGMWFASRRAIDRGLAGGSSERAEAALEQAA